MEKNEKKIIFFNSFLPRTGHNFAAEALKVFTDHEVLPYKNSETRLSTFLESYYEIYDNLIFNQRDKKFANNLFIADLRDKILAQSNKKFVMIKDTSFKGLDRLPEIFPDDLHFVLTRDPKNVFLSLLKAMTLAKKTWKNRAKRLGIPVGMYPYFYSRKLSNQVLQNFPKMKHHTIIKYEDLVKKEDHLLIALKEIFGTDKNLDQIKQEIEEIEVINSSFYKENKGKKIWDKQPKSSDFNPLQRKGGNFMVTKGVELGSHNLRKKLHYI